MLKRERKQLQYVCKQYHHPIVLGMALTFSLTLLVFFGGMGGLYLYFSLLEGEIISVSNARLTVSRVILISICFLPIIVFMFWQLGWRVTYHTVGALQRITIELQRRIKTGEKTPITIRKNDRIHALVLEINRLLELNGKPKKPGASLKKQDPRIKKEIPNEVKNEGSPFFGEESEA